MGDDAVVAQDGNRNRIGGGPIAIALAVAILICAVPLAYRISQCEQFDSGFSLERLFSFKCERSADSGRERPDTRQDGTTGSTDTAAAEQADAPRADAELHSTALTGHVYYEESGQKAVGDDAAYVIPGTSRAPPYEEIRQGTVLKTVRTSVVRSGPAGGDEQIAEIGGGRCVKILQRPNRPVPDLQAADSGGWLLVQVIRCPP